MAKADDYAKKITLQLAEIFSEDCDNYIDANEFKEDDNMTEFIHALANLAPAMLCGKLTGQERNLLDFNHMANHLIFQNNKS